MQRNIMAKKTYTRPSVTTFQVDGSMLMEPSIGKSEEEAWEDACAPALRDFSDDTDEKGDSKWGW